MGDVLVNGIPYAASQSLGKTERGDFFQFSCLAPSSHKMNLATIRVHDLKHTFGRRLRAAGVSFEDRQDLLGHKSRRITTHYSTAELHSLLKAANNACRNQVDSINVTILKKPRSCKTPTPRGMDIGNKVLRL